MPAPAVPPKEGGYYRQNTTSTITSTNSSSSYSAYSSSSSSSLPHNNINNRHNTNDDDLATAVRDVVYISTPRSSNTSSPLLGLDGVDYSTGLPAVGVGLTHQHQAAAASSNSPRSSGRREHTPMASHTNSHSQSSFDMSSISTISTGPESGVASSRRTPTVNVNPFEEDEIEPPQGYLRSPPVPAKGYESSGVVHASRTKFNRAHTTQSTVGLLRPTSPNGKKSRRSASTDSSTVLMSGQVKASEEKKGSKHVDVIDSWDPTGLGSAMWHHSGPYDAAAPSRNLNLPATKAPMHAFNGVPLKTPPTGGSTTVPLRPESPGKPPLSRGDSNVSGKSVGTENVVAVSGGRRPAPPRPSPTPRRQSGSLSGQYSTSMPTSGGGYFPSQEPTIDEASASRNQRQKQREDKRRALKAAWGTDTPEPFEDFGSSPQDEVIDLAEDVYSPDLVATFLPSRGPRSPIPTPPLQSSGPFGYASKREKTLPLPPVGPVIPSFDDFVTSPPRNLASMGATPPHGETDLPPLQKIKRKPSVVKRIKDRMAK